jgi:hypothetical protein
LSTSRTPPRMLLKALLLNQRLPKHHRLDLGNPRWHGWRGFFFAATKGHEGRNGTGP